MTELEFEKACRGPLTPVANEYAWGSTSMAGASNFTNGGAINETTNTVGANAVFGNIINLQSPIRVGVFATGSSTREQAGSGYYGMMELSGNIWECCVTAGNVTGRTFTGIQGNGQLDATGVSDAPNWPPASAIGAGFRGGNLVNSALILRISDRDYAASPSSSRHLKSGGRGVRLAP
jgi:formylglycine-generating enzyme required for sulfatase activity